jgi:hypothetical protein
MHRSRHWVMLLGSEQEVKPIHTAFVAGQYSSAFTTIHSLPPQRQWHFKR